LGGSRKETGPPRISIKHVTGTRWNYHTAAGNKSTQPYTVTVDGETGLRAPRELYGGAETALTHIVFKLPMQFEEELFESYRREWGKKHPRRATANPGASGGCRKTKQYKHAIGDL